MRVVLDAWPLATLIAGSYVFVNALERTTTGERLLALCRAGAVDFRRAEVEGLTRFVSGARHLVTTGCVVAEVFHHLERATDSVTAPVLMRWAADRLPGVVVVDASWEALLTHPASLEFGVADGSAVLATQATGATLILQDARLHGWCVRHRVSARTCVELIWE